MTNRPQAILSLADAKRRNADAGFFFFEKATMLFFHSRVSEASFSPCEELRCTYFVTSEQNRSFGGETFPRLFTVRAIAWNTGGVRTVGESQAYETLAKAIRFAKGYASRDYIEPRKGSSVSQQRVWKEASAT